MAKWVKVQVSDELHRDMRVEAAKRGVSLQVLALERLSREKEAEDQVRQVREPQPRVASPVEPEPRPVRDFSKTTQVKARK